MQTKNGGQAIAKVKEILEITSKNIFSGMVLASSASSNRARYVTVKACISSMLGEPDLQYIISYELKNFHRYQQLIQTSS